MDDIVRQAQHYFALFQNWLGDLWNTLYNYLVNSLGDNGAKMVVIVGALILVYFFLFKFINRD